MRGWIVSGTDTDVGKTVVSALLTLALNAVYWKPVQTGTGDGTDTERVLGWTGLPPDRVLPEAYRLAAPEAPAIAAAREGVTIDLERLRLASHPVPRSNPDRPLVVEGAGGLMVPIAPGLLQVDLFEAWELPVVLVARTGLGTINHTLLSVQAIRARGLHLHGLVFCGAPRPEVEGLIREISGLRLLGRVPWLPRIDAGSLRRVFTEGFQTADWS